MSTFDVPRPFDLSEVFKNLWRARERINIEHSPLTWRRMLEMAGTTLLALVLAFGIVIGIGFLMSSRGAPPGAPFILATLAVCVYSA